MLKIKSINDCAYGELKIKDKTILFEDEKKRTKNAKYFKLENNDYYAMFSSENYHYFDENQKKFVDIDNTLQVSSSKNYTDFDGYENKNNNIKIKVAKNINNQALYRISYNNCEIKCYNFNDELNTCSAKINNVINKRNTYFKCQTDREVEIFKVLNSTANYLNYNDNIDLNLSWTFSRIYH